MEGGGDGESLNVGVVVVVIWERGIPEPGVFPWRVAEGSRKARVGQAIHRNT